MPMFGNPVDVPKISNCKKGDLHWKFETRRRLNDSLDTPLLIEPISKKDNQIRQIIYNL